MSGSPVTPALLSFGPEFFENDGAILDPKKHVSKDQLNLWKWEIAGNSITANKAWVVVSSAGAWVASGAKWNPKGDAALRPKCAKTATGVYTVTWAASYADQNGVSRQVTLYAAKAFPQTTTANIVAVASVSGVVATVKITTANTGVAIDCQFLLEVR